MANPFKDWNEVTADEHNRRVAACKSAPKIGDNAAAILAKPIKAWKDPYAILKPRKPLLNKTERRFLEILRVDHRDYYIGCQNITFWLGHDLRYTPDFWIAGFGIRPMTFWEVKGPFIREDSMVKLKTAAAMFPMFTFILAQEQEKGGKWTTKTIPPL